MSAPFAGIASHIEESATLRKLIVDYPQIQRQILLAPIT